MSRDRTLAAAVPTGHLLRGYQGEIPLGPESESRDWYNDVDDYNGVNDQPPLGATGNVLTNYQSYRVQVSVSYAGNELGYANNRAAKRITINVTTPLGNVIPVSGYRMNF